MSSVFGFLSNYGTNFRAALLMWPVASALLTLPLLAYLYHKDGKLRFEAVLASYLCVLYFAGLVCFTLWPLPEGDVGPGITYGIEPNFIPFHFIADMAKDGIRVLFEELANIVFFLPLGFIAGRFLRMRLVPTIFLSLAVSALIELSQFTGLFGIYAYSYRCCDVDDLIANTLGGLLGWFLASAFTKRVPEPVAAREVSKHPGLLHRCIALWIDTTIAYTASMLVWSIIESVCRLVTGEAISFGGLGYSETSIMCLNALFAILLAIDEIVVPWRHEGKTLGGAFTKMTCEDRPRALKNRILFYAARSFTLSALFVWPFPVALALMVFYAIKRCMPCDLIP